MGFFGAMYHSLLLRFCANKEVMFNCNDLVRPMLSSVYHGESRHVLRMITGDATAGTKWADNVQLQAASNSEDPIDIVVIDTTGSENPDKMSSKRGLYIFVYDTQEKYEEMVCSYNEYLMDKEILTVCMSSACYRFVQSAVMDPRSNVTVEVRDMVGYWERSLLSIFLIALLGLVHFVCIRVTEYVSKFDPAFSDFNIASSCIVKFKDLPRMPMPQCSICFEEFIPEDDVRVLDCKHYYHPTCIDRWLIGHSKRCPCCRNNIEINEKV